MVSDHVLLHLYPTTDGNTSMGMIWVTLNMLSATSRQGIVREFHIVWRVVNLTAVAHYLAAMTVLIELAIDWS